MKKILLLVILAGLILGVYYFIFSKEEWDEDNSFTRALSSENQKYLEGLSQENIQKQVFYTMPEIVLRPQFEGKIFCASELYGIDKNMEDLSISVYLFGYCEEYYIKGETITLGGGVSHPMRIVYKLDGKKLTYDNITVPKDGNVYKESIKDFIPEKYLDKATKGIDLSKITPLPKIQAENYYTGKLEVYF